VRIATRTVTPHPGFSLWPGRRTRGRRPDAGRSARHDRRGYPN